MEDERSYRAEVGVDATDDVRRVRVEEERATRHSSARDGDDDDDRRGIRLPGMSSVSADTLTDCYRGLARSIAEGLRAYEREIDPDTVTRLGIDNGHTDGLLSGAARFWEEFASTMSRTADNLRDDRDRARDRSERQRTRDRERDSRPRDENPPQIDYERLARLVAQELKKPQTIVVTPSGAPTTLE